MIDLENVVELLYLSDMHQAMELKRMSINFTMQYFDIVTKREDFKKLSKSILLELLQNKWNNQWKRKRSNRKLVQSQINYNDLIITINEYFRIIINYFSIFWTSSSLY